MVTILRAATVTHGRNIDNKGGKYEELYRLKLYSSLRWSHKLSQVRTWRNIASLKYAPGFKESVKKTRMKSVSSFYILAT